MMKNVLLVVFYVSLSVRANSGEKLKSCDQFILGCPDNAVCRIKKVNGVEITECECDKDREFEFNTSYKNESDYCIHSPIMQATTAGSAAGGLPLHPEKTASAISQNEPPSSHHIVGGILIPIFIVLSVIGLAYGVKRLNIVRRVRDMMIARRNRPFYEDVMMSNDNDDPPLI